MSYSDWQVSSLQKRYRHGPWPFQMCNRLWCIMQTCLEPCGTGHSWCITGFDVLYILSPMNMHRHGPCPFQMRNWFWCLIQTCSEPCGIGHCHGHSRSVTGFGVLLTGSEPYTTSTFVTIPEVEPVLVSYSGAFFGLEKVVKC